MANGQFAGQFGLAIDAERTGCIRFLPWPFAAAVEHVVRRVMDQPGTQPGGFLRQHGGRARVDGAGQIRFRFGLVHGGMSGGIDDDVGRNFAHAGGQTGEIVEIAAQAAIPFAVEGDDLAERCQTALQFPANLAALAEKQDLHWSRPW